MPPLTQHIDTLKKNQMQLAQTVQGLPEALATQQQQSTVQADALAKLRVGRGVVAGRACVDRLFADMRCAAANYYWQRFDK